MSRIVPPVKCIWRKGNFTELIGYLEEYAYDIKDIEECKYLRRCVNELINKIRTYKRPNKNDEELENCFFFEREAADLIYILFDIVDYKDWQIENNERLMNKYKELIDTDKKLIDSYRRLIDTCK